MSTSVSLRSLRFVCYVGMAYLMAWLLVVILRLLRYFQVISLDMGLGIDLSPIAWYEDSAGRSLQWIELMGSTLTSLVMIVLLFVFIRRILSHLKGGQIFVMGNSNLLFAMSVVGFLTSLFGSNRHILFGERYLVLTSSPLLTLFLFLVVGLLYKVAEQVAQENNLTI